MDRYWKDHPQIGQMIKLARNVGVPQSVGMPQNVGKVQNADTSQNVGKVQNEDTPQISDEPLDLSVRKIPSVSPSDANNAELVALEEMAELAAEVAYKVLEA